MALNFANQLFSCLNANEKSNSVFSSDNSTKSAFVIDLPMADMMHAFL